MRVNSRQLKKENVPKLRFSEFSGEWDSTKLGAVAEFLKGVGISKEDICKDGENKCIRYGELYTQYKEVINKVVSRTNVLKEDSLSSYKYDVLIPSSGETALDIANASCVIEENVLLGGDLNVIRLNKNQNGIFFAYYLSNFQKINIAKLSQGNSVVHLYNSHLKTLKINLPTELEQQKIAKFLTSVDNWIENLKKQKENLENYKKGIMQKIFFQEIRFKDDNGKNFPDWEEKKVKNIFEVTRGNVLAVKNMQDLPSIKYQYPIYSSQTKNGGLIGYYDQFLFEDAITWTTDGANAGDVNFRKGKFYCTNVCGVLISKEGYANKFMSELLNSVAKRYVSYVGNPKLMNNVMEQIRLKCASISEQEKISNFLVSIEDLLDSKEHQITRVEQWKKGLVQNLFI